MRKAFFAAALSLAFLSCSPPFDAGLSQAAFLASKMTNEGTLGPITSGLDPLDPDAVFLPQRTGVGIDPSRGFIRFQSSFGARLWYAQAQETGGFTVISGWGGQNDLHPTYPMYQFQTLHTGNLLAACEFHSDRPNDNQLWIAFPRPGDETTPSGIITSFWTDLGSLTSAVTGGVIGTVLGGGIIPLQGANRGAWLVRTTGYWEVQSFLEVSPSDPSAVTISSTILAGSPMDLPFLPADLSRCLYFNDPDPSHPASFVQFLSDGQWRCWKWSFDPLTGFPPVLLPGIAHRIDALLTTGELFSTEDGMGRLYDSDGNERAAFSLGSIRFAFEEYRADVPRVFFSLYYAIDGQASFGVYSLPTADLELLAGS